MLKFYFASIIYEDREGSGSGSIPLTNGYGSESGSPTLVQRSLTKNRNVIKIQATEEAATSKSAQLTAILRSKWEKKLPDLNKMVKQMRLRRSVRIK